MRIQDVDQPGHFVLSLVTWSLHRFLTPPPGGGLAQEEGKKKASIREVYQGPKQVQMPHRSIQSLNLLYDVSFLPKQGTGSLVVKTSKWRSYKI